MGRREGGRVVTPIDKADQFKSIRRPVLDVDVHAPADVEDGVAP